MRVKPHHPDVILIYDGQCASHELTRMLERGHSVLAFPLHGEIASVDAPLLVLDIDINNACSARQARVIAHEIAPHAARLFVLTSSDRREIVQAYSLGAHDFVARPFSTASLDRVLEPLFTHGVERSWERLSPIQMSALKVSLKLFECTHAQAVQGLALRPDATATAARLVVEASRHNGLEQLLTALRGHHNYSFRHSMFVAGTLVSFADILGFNAADTELIATAGLMHDVGKLAAPTTLLDKPGRLEAWELATLREHPRAGAELLRREEGWPAEVIDAVLHHHERMDGKGYPDAAPATAISDISRIVSIADAFSALIDKRAYKPPMAAADAFMIMRESEGQFDQKLLEAFEPVALSLKSGHHPK